MTFVKQAHSVLILGGEGQLGSALRQVSWPDGFAPGFISRAQCDIVNAQSVQQVLDTLKPVSVINAAAFTNVDLAEREEEVAAAVNAIGPGLLARACQKRNVPLIHISTDYVFDGHHKSPYTESSKPSPINAYGRTKLAGDLAVQQHAERHLIFRTSWLYSARPGNFVTKMLQFCGKRPEVRVITDQIGCPTYALDLAQAISSTLLRCVDGDDSARGMFNYAGAGETSWFDFARSIFALAQGQADCPRVDPISSETFGAAARRPAYSVLDCGRSRNVLGLLVRDWRDSLTECFDELKQAQDKAINKKVLQ
jgi:dTDP-4-dehydrorhamnose reductase